ncbi:MAG TPA: hypothetical protein VK990_06205 [Acidimicrobiia bacterium]|nr:hypothetical protein [Acidimicrobiia bacterium]
MANRRGESGIHHSAAATAIALLFVAACGGDSGSSTTSSTTSTSVPGSSTTTEAGTTTQPPTTGGTGTTAETPDTLPPVIAEVAFAFAAGDDPRLRVRVSVAENRDGPWLSAGIFDPTPTLSGASYWVRFEITNVDRLNAVLTDLDVTGFEAGSPFGEDVCELEAPLRRDDTATCIIGGFPVQPGSNDVDFSVAGTGPRQGEPERWFDPPVPTSLEFGGARHSFVLVFDTTEGIRVDGTADASQIEIDTEGLFGAVRLDCAGGNPYDGTPGLKAYVIENFSAGGDRVGGCSEIPSAVLDFFPDGDSDDAYFYEGVVGDTTSTSASG